MMEQPSSPAEKKPKRERPAAVDTAWYDRFAKAAAFEDFKYLEGKKEDRDALRQSFLAGAVENPTITYPKLAPFSKEELEAMKPEARAELETLSDGVFNEQLIKFEQELLALKADMLGKRDPKTGVRDTALSERNPVVQQAYRWRINEKIASIRMLRAVAMGTKTIEGERKSDEEIAKHKARQAKRFQRYSKYIYGEPQTEIFSYSLDELTAKASAATTNEDENIRQAAEDLLKVLPHVEQTTSENKRPQLPKAEIVQRVKDPMEKLLARALPKDWVAPLDTDVLSPEQIVDIFNVCLKNLKAKGWSAVIDKNSAGVNVSQAAKKVFVPTARPDAEPRTYERVKELIVHEIGTHVMRRVNGERSKLKLLGLGLRGYDSGEEGVATARGDSLAGAVETFSSLEGHLAISLARGLDGKPRTFRQVYEILEKHFYLKNLLDGKEPEKAATKAKTSAYDRCMRTFRGTSGEGAGNAYTKDMIYREGNIAVWDLIGKNPEEMLRFSIGKYDPTNPYHIWILEQLGITDKDLEDLESEDEE